jgi:hypothetical protein
MLCSLASFVNWVLFTLSFLLPNSLVGSAPVGFSPGRLDPLASFHPLLFIRTCHQMLDLQGCFFNRFLFLLASLCACCLQSQAFII